MKRNTGFRILFLSLSVLALMVIMVGCEPEGMSIDDRIDAFMDTLNSGGDIKQHFSSTNTGYSTFSGSALTGSSQVFEPSQGPFTWQEVDRTGSSIVTVTGSIDCDNGGTPAVVFVMVSEPLSGLMGGEDWKIYTIEVAGYSPLPSP
jgi:hypothetical protein